jgi:hypothetical protein
MSEPRLVTCSRHGLGPCYAACLHVADGAHIAQFDRATETHIGEAICCECMGRDLTADDCLIICAGCMAELEAAQQ